MCKTAFVTGGTGFLGVNLIHQLEKDGWDITAIYRHKVNHPLLKNANVNWVKVSLFDVDALANAMPNDEFVVFHMAASTTQWQPLFKEQHKINVEGTASVIEAALRKNVKRFIHTSSITTFGLHKATITENSKSNAQSTGLHYGITKRKAEELIEEAVKNKNLNAVILNPCHIIGPWDTNNWIQIFTHVSNQTLPGIPPSSGNFAWVEEVARAHISAIEKGAIGEKYILGGPYFSVLALIQEIQRQLKLSVSKKTTPAFLLRSMLPFYWLISKLTNKEPTLTPDKVTLLLKSYSADDTKAQKHLGYQHKSIEEIVSKTLAWKNAQ